MAEHILANVARVDMITEETTPELISGDTGDEVTLEPYISEGKEDFLRSKNRILAQNNFEDLVMGYNIGLKEVNYDPEQFAILDGGTYSAVTGPPAGYNYSGPAMGTAVSRTPVTLDIWTEEKDTDGTVVCYHRFRFKHVKGKPVKFTHKDGSFYAPEYNLRSRAAKTEYPILIDQFAELPTGTAAELLALPAAE
jgi:hypothetical protein